MARPVHQTGRLEGGVVEVVDADLLGDLAGDGLVLVRRDLSVEGHDQTVAGLRLGVLMCGVDRQGVVDLQVVDDVVPELGRREVQVEGEQLAGRDVAGLAAAIPQMTADEAADVLDLVLLLLAHLHVLGVGLRGLHGAGELIQESRPAHGLIFPGGLEAAAAGRDQEVAVVLDHEQGQGEFFRCVGHGLSTSAFCLNFSAVASAASNSRFFFRKAERAPERSAVSFFSCSRSSCSRSG